VKAGDKQEHYDRMGIEVLNLLQMDWKLIITSQPSQTSKPVNGSVLIHPFASLFEDLDRC
jgi:hypothetical protein